MEEKTKEIVERLNKGGAFKPTATGSYHFIAMNRAEFVEAADIITRLSERVGELETESRKSACELLSAEACIENLTRLLSKQEER